MSFSRLVTVVLSLGFVGMGVLLSAVGTYQAATAVDHWRVWPKAQAVVIENEFRTVRTKQGSVTIAEPVFRFSVDGRTVQAKSRTGRAPPEFSAGDQVTIAYNPRDPSEVTQKVDARGGAFILVGVGAGLALSGLALGFVLTWLRRAGEA